MKSIKEQIEALIQSYIDNFAQATGLQLIAYTPIRHKATALSYMIEVAKEMFRIDVRQKRRFHEITRIRRMVVATAMTEGHSPSDISKELDMDRTACYGILDLHNTAMKQDKIYRDEYNEYIRVLYNK